MRSRQVLESFTGMAVRGRPSLPRLMSTPADRARIASQEAALDALEDHKNAQHEYRRGKREVDHCLPLVARRG